MGTILFRGVREPITANMRLLNVISFAIHLVIGCLFFLILNIFYEGVQINELPRNIDPIAYDIQLTPHLNNFTFTGKVDILIQVKNESNNITLNINNLNIKEVLLFKKNVNTNLLDSEGVHKIKMNYDTKSENPKVKYINDFMIIYPTSNLKTENKYGIRIKYEGFMNAKMEGLFGHSYFNHKHNKVIRYAVSHFYPNHARKVFPCFDDPYFNSEFGITINTPKDLEAFTSLHRRIITTSSTNDTISYRFLGSGKISTQLIALAILNPYDSNIDPNHKLWKCLSASATVIFQKFNSQYYYPNISEINNILIIYNTTAKAFNHVGLITLSSSGNYYEDNKSFGDKFKSCLRVTYLGALNAFMYNILPIQGNEWLAKAFAQHITNIVFKSNELESLYGKNDDLFMFEWRHALLQDGMLNSLQTYGNQSEYQQKLIRNHLLHYKGNAVLTLSVNESVLEKMMRELFSNPSESKMYDFKKFCTTIKEKGYIDDNIQSGYPLVTLTTDYENGKKKLEFIQKQFIYGNKVTSNDSLIWRIPANYYIIKSISINQNEYEHEYTTSRIPILLQQKQTKIVIVDSQLNDVVYMPSGYYRVNYEYGQWMGIIDLLCNPISKYQFTSEAEKSKFIDDAFNLARAGYLNYKIPLRLLCMLNFESAVSVLHTAIKSMVYLLHIFEPHAEKYNILQEKFDHAIPRQNALQNSSIVFAATCEFGRKTSLNRSLILFSAVLEWYRPATPISIKRSGFYGIPTYNIKTVLCIGIRKSDDTVFKYMFNRYFSTIYTEDKYLLIYAISCTQKEHLMKLILNNTLSSTRDDMLRIQDISVVIKRLSKSYIGRYNILLFFKNKFQNLVERIGEKEMVKMIKIVVQNLVVREEITDATTWIKGLPDKIDPSNILGYALDIAELNNEVFTRSAIELKDFFKL